VEAAAPAETAAAVDPVDGTAVTATDTNDAGDPAGGDDE
jgi:hypothetical protein